MKNVFVGERLKELRKLKGRTQADIASYFGISKQAVSKWEKGLSMPDVLLLPEIAKYFDVEIDYFFEQVDANKNMTPVVKDKVAIEISSFTKKYDNSKENTIEDFDLKIYDGVSTISSNNIT